MNPEGQGYQPSKEEMQTDKDKENEASSEKLNLDSFGKDFDESELIRKERLAQGLPPRGELNVEINHAEYLAASGDSDGKRLLNAALEKKRNYFAGISTPEYRPQTQTQTERKSL